MSIMFLIMLLLTLVGFVVGVGQPVQAEPLDPNQARALLCRRHAVDTGVLTLPFVGIFDCR